MLVVPTNISYKVNKDKKCLNVANEVMQSCLIYSYSAAAVDTFLSQIITLIIKIANF